MKALRVAAIFVALLLLVAAAPRAGGCAPRLGRQRRREDRARRHESSRCARNSAWDGRTVRLFGARNEIVAFQVDRRSGRTGHRRAERRSAARWRPPADRITYRAPASDPTDYVDRADPDFHRALHARDDRRRTRRGSTTGSPRRLRRIRLDGSPCSWFRRTRARDGAAARSRYGLAKTRRSGSRSTSTARGRRACIAAAIEVRADGATRSVPIELEVFGFTLPDENSMHAMLYYSSDQPELYHGRNLDAAYNRFAHRQRVELVHAYDEADAAAAWDRFSGADFTRAARLCRAPVKASATCSYRAVFTVRGAISTIGRPPGPGATPG